MIVDLHDTRDAHGKILGPSGAPLQGRVQIDTMSLPERPGAERTNDYLCAPAPLARELESTLAEDGSFVIHGVPADGELNAWILAPGYNRLGVTWNQPQLLDLRLEKPGEVHIRFAGVADPKQLAGIPFHLSRPSSPRKEKPNSIFSWTEVKSSPDGSLSIPGLYPGSYSFSPQNNVEIPVEIPGSTSFQVQPGKTTELTLAVKPRARVQGRVIARTSGQGLPGVTVVFYSPVETGGSQYHGQTLTDTAGRFTAFERPGPWTLGFHAPTGYLSPQETSREPHKVEAKDTWMVPDVVLEPAVPVTGVVQDAAGRPIPGIRIVTAHGNSFLGEIIRTDAAGRFTINDLGPKDVTALRARTAKAVTNGAIPLDVFQQKGPIKLVLSEAYAFQLQGRVCDNSGQPVVDAGVQIEWQYRGVGRAANMGIGAFLGTYRTDAEGRFQTQALWPGDQYKVRVKATGCGPGESGRVEGKAGQNLDLGTITVPRLALVAGVVLDRTGQPITGAKVFNRGDAPIPLDTTSDGAGRFQLQGLLAGPVYVFAHKEGYRFSLVRAKAGDTSLILRMLPAGDPGRAIEQPNPRPASYVAAEQKLTRHLLERLWALPRSVTRGHVNRVLEGMASVDLAQARKWLAEEGKRDPAVAEPNSRMSRIIRIAEAEKAAGDDVEEALALLAPLQAEHVFSVLLRLGERFAKTDAARAGRLVEEAVVKARAQPLPERARSLAQAGLWRPGWGSPQPAVNC